MAEETGVSRMRDALLPVEQATVEFYGHQIIAVRLPDGRIAAVFSAMCEALQLDRRSQVRRVQEDEVLVDQLLLALVETSGGAQSTDVLTAWAIPTWLQGIQLSRVATEKRATILAFKREAADALYRHFSQAHITSLTSPAVPAAPIERPVAPEADAPRNAWREYYQTMVRFMDWQDEVEQWRSDIGNRQEMIERRQDNLEDRLEGVEELARLFVEVTERLGPETLSTTHQRWVQGAVKRLHDVTGASFAAIYAELGEAFQVAKYSDIPESHWPHVEVWFAKKLA